MTTCAGIVISLGSHELSYCSRWDSRADPFLIFPRHICVVHAAGGSLVLHAITSVMPEFTFSDDPVAAMLMRLTGLPALSVRSMVSTRHRSCHWIDSRRSRPDVPLHVRSAASPAGPCVAPGPVFGALFMRLADRHTTLPIDANLVLLAPVHAVAVLVSFLVRSATRLAA
jgi:hypothetical protein